MVLQICTEHDSHTAVFYAQFQNAWKRFKFNLHHIWYTTKASEYRHSFHQPCVLNRFQRVAVGMINGSGIHEEQALQAALKISINIHSSFWWWQKYTSRTVNTADRMDPWFKSSDMEGQMYVILLTNKITKNSHDKSSSRIYSTPIQHFL